jgi:serine/threonine protein phosphatase 1
MKTFVIGDIHGANRALVQVLEKCGFDYDNDLLISLGDIADGWSETSECVDTLLKIKNRIDIRGNHDVWVYDWLKWGKTPTIWVTQGGQATLDSYMKSQRFVDEDHKQFWENQIDWHVDDKNRLFVHAGWDPYTKDPFKAMIRPQHVQAGSIAKGCHWNRDLTNLLQATPRDSTKQKFTEMFAEVYVGHTATRGEVFNYNNFWNMDTGAGWHGVLSIMDIDTKEIWQSDLVKDLYPEEKGRT